MLSGLFLALGAALVIGGVYLVFSLYFEGSLSDGVSGAVGFFLLLVFSFGLGLLQFGCDVYKRGYSEREPKLLISPSFLYIFGIFLIILGAYLILNGAKALFIVIVGVVAILYGLVNAKKREKFIRQLEEIGDSLGVDLRND